MRSRRQQGFQFPCTYQARTVAARNWLDVTPVSWRKTEVRWLGSAKPASRATPGKRPIGPAHQRLGALETALHDVALWTDPKRQLEGAAEVIGTKTRHSGEIG